MRIYLRKRKVFRERILVRTLMRNSGINYLRGVYFMKSSSLVVNLPILLRISCNLLLHSHIIFLLLRRARKHAFLLVQALSQLVGSPGDPFYLPGGQVRNSLRSRCHMCILLIFLVFPNRS